MANGPRGWTVDRRKARQSGAAGGSTWSKLRAAAYWCGIRRVPRIRSGGASARVRRYLETGGTLYRVRTGRCCKWHGKPGTRCFAAKLEALGRVAMTPEIRHQQPGTGVRGAVSIEPLLNVVLRPGGDRGIAQVYGVPSGKRPGVDARSARRSARRVAPRQKLEYHCRLALAS